MANPTRAAAVNPDALPDDPIQAGIKDAFIGGVIALGLFVLLIGLETTQNIRNELIINQRWGWLAVVVAAVMIVRFIMTVLVRPMISKMKASQVRRSDKSPSKFLVFMYKYGNLIIASLIFGFMVRYILLNVSVTETWTRLSIVGAIYAIFVIKEITALVSSARDDDGSSLSIGPLRELFKKRLSQNGLLSLFFYPVIVIAMVGLASSLKWVDNYGIQILIYVMLAWGLNIVVGLAGLLDLGYVAFYAVGAYSYSILSDQFGLSFWILLPVAGILAAFWGIILGFPVLRLRGDYLAIVTLAFGEIIRLVLINWTEVTKGTFGISGIQRATLFGMEFNASPTGFAATFGLAPSSAYYKIFLFYLILLLCLLTAYVTIRLRRMPIGRAWEALREDEIACRSLGINTTTTKLTAFATGAMFGGFAGAFFAVRQGFVSPESFVFIESAIILAIVVLGGMGSLPGIAIAAAVMIGGTEGLRELEFLKTGAKYYFDIDFTPELYRMLLFGLAMVVVMLWKPRGFVGTREPTAFLKTSKAVSGAFTKEGHG